LVTVAVVSHVSLRQGFSSIVSLRDLPFVALLLCLLFRFLGARLAGILDVQLVRRRVQQLVSQFLIIIVGGGDVHGMRLERFGSVHPHSAVLISPSASSRERAKL
jgi:hypothetical protein